MDRENELRELARLKTYADDHLLHRVDFSVRIARLFYLVIAGIIAATLWLGSLQWQVSLNKNYIDDEKHDKVQERLHDAEEAGKRRDKQIERLNQKIFSVPDY